LYLSSDLLAIGRQPDDLIPGRAQGAAKQLAGVLDTAMADAAEGLSPTALTAWREANKFYKAGKTAFNSTLIKRLGTAEPDMIYDALIKPGRPTMISKAHKIIGPEGWNAVQGQFFTDLLRRSSNDIGEVGGAKMLAELAKFGDDTLNAIVGKPSTATAKQLARTLQLTQEEATTGNFKMLIQFMQAGAVSGLVLAPSSEGKMKYAAVFMAPPVLAKVLTNPTTASYLIRGLKDAEFKKIPQLTNLLVRMGAQRLENYAPEPNIEMLKTKTPLTEEQKKQMQQITEAEVQ